MMDFIHEKFHTEGLYHILLLLHVFCMQIQISVVSSSIKDFKETSLLLMLWFDFFETPLAMTGQHPLTFNFSHEIAFLPECCIFKRRVAV